MMDRDQALNVARNPGNPANYHHSVKDKALAVLADENERLQAVRDRALMKHAEQYNEINRLRYVQVRVEDHNELSDALGVERGTVEWHRLIETVTRNREIVERAVKMLPHENGFGGDVAHYIVTGEARKGRA